MLLICLAVAGLVAPGEPGCRCGAKPLPLYIAFGLLTGYGFWFGVSAMNQRDWLSLLFVLVIVVGAVWSLREAELAGTDLHDSGDRDFARAGRAINAREAGL